MRIQVTQTDINKGKCGDPNTCAVAQALFNTFKPILALGKNLVVSVGTDTATISVAEGETDTYKHLFSHTFTLPAKVRKFINKFDENKKSVKPISFDMPVAA